MSNAPRLIVAAKGPDGKSCVVREAALPASGLSSAPDGSMQSLMSVMNLATGPIGARVDNAAPLGDPFPPFDMAQLTGEVYSWMIAEYAPGLGADDPGMHFTNTADHFFILEGEVVLVLESGDVVMRAGDAGVCRGAVHGWRNDGDTVARLVTFVLPAEES